MHALTRSVGQNGAAAIDDVTSRHLPGTRLKNVRHHIFAIMSGITFEDRKDSADGNISVDVARAIEWVKENNVPSRGRLLNDVRFVILLRNQNADSPAIPEAPNECFIGELIQLLDFFSLNIDPASITHDLEQTRTLHISGDDFRCQRNARKQPTELFSRMRIAPFTFEKVALHCGYQWLIGHWQIRYSGFRWSQSIRPEPNQRLNSNWGRPVRVKAAVDKLGPCSFSPAFRRATSNNFEICS